MKDIQLLLFYLSPLACLIIFGLLMLFFKPVDHKSSRISHAAFGLSLIPLIITIGMAFDFNPSAVTQFSFDRWWIESLGISLSFGTDGISLLLVLLTNFLVPVIILSSYNREIKNIASFYSLIFLMQFALVGVFTALDGFLFYIFWEMALIPIYFIALLWGGKNSARITLKFFIYTMTGSLFMLLGLIYLYLQTPAPHTFSIQAFYNLQLSGTQQSYLFWAFFLAFAIKMPIWPFHTWQPDTYTDSPTQGTMLLSGIMLKMGIYGVIRWMLPVLPLGVAEWSNVAIVLCVIGIVYASCIALVQNDFKRMLAYSSIAHIGLIAAGIFTLNVQGLQGAVVQMISHGVNVVGLFFIADILFDRFKTRDLDHLGGIANKQSTFSILFIIILLGSVALPLTNGFVGEFLLLNGVYQYSSTIAIFAGLTVILGAVYMLRSYQSIMLGDKMHLGVEFNKLKQSETALLSIIAAVVILTGLYPKWILDIAEPSVNALMQHLK